MRCRVYVKNYELKHSMATISFSTILSSILSFELLLGGQARITGLLTPSIHERVMAKAPGTREALSFIPIRNDKQHTQFIGCAMCLAGVLVAVPQTRSNLGAVLTLALTSAGVYSQRRMGISYKVPVMNSVLTVMMVLSRHYKV